MLNNSSKVLIVTSGDSGNTQLLNSSCSSVPLVQRRCQSLCKFTGDDETKHSVIQQQFLCVPQQFHHSKTPRYRKESKSLELFPAELRCIASDSSIEPLRCSREAQGELEDSDKEEEEEEEEEEVVGLLKNTKDAIVLQVPAGDEGTVQRLSLASGETRETDEMDENPWESSDQLRPLDSDMRRDKASVKFSKRVRAVKQWLGSLLGRRTPSPIDDHFNEELERESIV